MKSRAERGTLCWAHEAAGLGCLIFVILLGNEEFLKGLFIVKCRFKGFSFHS